MTTNTKIWAHRGASSLAPENTMPAFEKAIELGADGIELDVHMTLDGQLVVIHDETVDRTSNGTGRIADMTLSQLRELDFSNGMPGYRGTEIPTLKEVYELVCEHRIDLNVELKCDRVIYWGIWDKLLAMEKKMGLQDRILYSSFNHYALVEMKKINPDCRIALLYSCGIVDPWMYAHYLEAEAIHPHYLALQAPGLIQGCREADIAIHPWTVDEENIMEAFFAANLDAIITNRTDVAMQVRSKKLY